MTCIRLETRCARGHIEIPDSGPKMRIGMEIEAEHIFLTCSSQAMSSTMTSVFHSRCAEKVAWKGYERHSNFGVLQRETCETRLGTLRFHLHGWISSRSIQSRYPQFISAYHISGTSWIDFGLIMSWSFEILFYTMSLCHVHFLENFQVFSDTAKKDAIGIYR